MRSLWAEHFLSLPNWPCPQCGSGHLLIIESTLQKEETRASKDAYSHDAWDPSWIHKRFSAHMTCSDKSCGEGAVISGTIRCEEDYDYDHLGRTQTTVEEIFYPKFIHPTPLVITIPEEAPADIDREVEHASALVWADMDSSANKLRLTAERILTALKVKKFKTIGGKRRPISLSERIDCISTSMPQVAELLHSIRYLGNHSSHETSQSIERNDLLNAFEIIEHVAELAFSQKGKRVLRTAREIKRRKGRPQRNGRSKRQSNR